MRGMVLTLSMLQAQAQNGATESAVSCAIELPNQSIRAISQDPSGLLLVGTFAGLSFYDGYGATLMQYRSDDSSSLSDNSIQSLYATDSVIWIGTQRGLNRLNPSTRSIRRYFSIPSDTSSLSHNTIFSIASSGRDGMIWIGTQNGLNRFDPKTGRCRRYAASQGRLSNAIVNAVSIWRDRFVLVGTRRGLDILDPVSDTFAHLDFATGSDTSINSINEIVLRGDTCWLGSMRGLIRVNLIDRKHSVIPLSSDHPYPVISSLLADHESNMWVGTSQTGLYKINQMGSVCQINLLGTGGKAVTHIPALFQDRRGTVWIGSDVKGVFKIDRYEKRLGNPSTSSNNYLTTAQVTAIHVTETEIFLGTLDGILVWNTRSEKNRLLRQGVPGSSPNSNRILSLYLDADENLWIGTNGGGLNHFDRKAHRFSYYRSNPNDHSTLTGPTVFCIAPKPGSKQLWIGTTRGLNLFDTDSGRVVRRYVFAENDTGSISNNRVHAVYYDRRGDMWIGTYDGLNRFDQLSGTFERFLHEPSNPSTLSSNVIWCMTDQIVGSDTVLWIGTHGGGLNGLNLTTGDFRTVMTTDGLPDDIIYGVLTDHHGQIWLSTNRGLARYDPTTGRIRTFDTHDGLLANEFNQGAYHQDKKGRLYFGNLDGLNVIDPDDLVENLVPPPVVLTSFRIHNKEALLDSSIQRKKYVTLGPDDRILSFEFAALSFSSSHKNRYAYRLDGFDRDWTYCDTRRYVSYTNLDPGTYTFRVKASNNDGVWNEAGTFLTIVIQPYYWQTWWFRFIMAGLALGLIYAGISWRRYYKEYRRLRYVSHFKILRKIGEGGMGEVFQARNFITGETVALKLLQSRLTEKETNRTRFLREGRFMTTLVHPNIVRIHETGEAAGRGYISMELLEGQPLSKRIAEFGALPWTTALEALLPVADALAFIHGHGIIHRDIKTENIFIRKERSTPSGSRPKRYSGQLPVPWSDRVVLMDFGLARSLDLGTITQADTIVGTLMYMAPEQAAGRKVDQRADIYSLGVVCFETLCGQPPFEDDNAIGLLHSMWSGKDTPLVSDLRPDVPSGVASLVRRMMDPDPERRFYTVNDVIQSMKDCLAQSSVRSDTGRSVLSGTSIKEERLTKSLVALEEVEKQPTRADAARVYLDHYKALTEAGQTAGASMYLDKAVSSMVTTSLSGDMGAEASDRGVIIETDTEAWRKNHAMAVEAHRAGRLTDARPHANLCVLNLKRALLLLNENQRTTYIRQYAVDRVLDELRTILSGTNP